MAGSVILKWLKNAAQKTWTCNQRPLFRKDHIIKPFLKDDSVIKSRIWLAWRERLKEDETALNYFLHLCFSDSNAVELVNKMLTKEKPCFLEHPVEKNLVEIILIQTVKVL